MIFLVNIIFFMKTISLLFFSFVFIANISIADLTDIENFNMNNFNELTEEERYVIEDKGTEAPYSGKYWDFNEVGKYNCKRCGAHLFDSNTKFSASCGWPSFDESIPGSVLKIPDSDGVRTEILCAKCGGHLGHVFYGEGFTDKNTRYCVNSLSLDFVSAEDQDYHDHDVTNKINFEARAYFAGGCFWGVEHYLEKLDGVESVISGFMGGHVKNPTYEQVVYTDTGHAETVEVVYDRSKISFEVLAKYFFEIHDPTQLNRQGPDIGTQYRSVIFYNNAEEEKITLNLIEILKLKGFDVVTKVEKVSEFYPAEDYHQDYYNKTGGVPYCHVYEEKF